MLPSRRIATSTWRLTAFSGDIADIKEPALILALVRNRREDGFLRMSEVFGLRLHADLVTLSACQTGLGELVPGEGIVGLTRAFLYAGTPSVLVSLWNVPDESTALLMERFYQHLRAGKDKAEALRAAKLELRKRYPAPFFWAPFILVGER